MNSVYLRLALYAVSTLLGMIPAALAGFVTYNSDTDILTISVGGLITALVVGLGATGGIFARWGVK